MPDSVLPVAPGGSGAQRQFDAEAVALAETGDQAGLARLRGTAPMLALAGSPTAGNPLMVRYAFAAAQEDGTLFAGDGTTKPVAKGLETVTVTYAEAGAWAAVLRVGDRVGVRIVETVAQLSAPAPAPPPDAPPSPSPKKKR